MTRETGYNGSRQAGDQTLRRAARSRASRSRQRVRLRAGKHVYCEKPLAHTVKEARIMQDEYLRRRDKVATQMGTQIHATENYRRIVELVQTGAIGSTCHSGRSACGGH